MSKISLSPTNDYCPQTLFLYGTYDENGKADFGLFCWFSYTWDTQLGVMACIGGSKLTKDNIHRQKVFSANLVTEEMLPLADYLGCTDGHNPEKMNLILKLKKAAYCQYRFLPSPPLSLNWKSRTLFSRMTVRSCCAASVTYCRMKRWRTVRALPWIS